MKCINCGKEIDGVSSLSFPANLWGFYCGECFSTEFIDKKTLPEISDEEGEGNESSETS